MKNPELPKKGGSDPKKQCLGRRVKKKKFFKNVRFPILYLYFDKMKNFFFLTLLPRHRPFWLFQNPLLNPPIFKTRVSGSSKGLTTSFNKYLASKTLILGQYTGFKDPSKFNNLASKTLIFILI